MSSIKLTASNFKDTMEQNDIVLVDFWASWCGPCKAFAPIFEEASEKHPDVCFAKVNTEEEQDLSGYFQIRSIPTIMAFRQNILLFSQPGMMPAGALDELIGKIKELDMDQVRAEIEKAEAEQQS